MPRIFNVKREVFHVELDSEMRGVLHLVIMTPGTIVQLARRKRGGTLDIPVRNPEDILAKAEGVGITPFTIDIPKDEADFLELYADYRNQLGELELADKKAKPGQKWTRKSLSEYLLRAEIQALKEQFAPIAKALGSLPDDDDAMRKYVARAFELKKKKSA
jgi:hypothetical protein